MAQQIHVKLESFQSFLTAAGNKVFSTATQEAATMKDFCLLRFVREDGASASELEIKWMYIRAAFDLRKEVRSLKRENAKLRAELEETGGIDPLSYVLGLEEGGHVHPHPFCW